MQEDERKKREEFIENNMGLVYSCAKRFAKKGVEYEDLVGAGNIGLCKAYDAFDPTRGFKFSTYAVPVILGEMRRLFRDGGTVKVGRTLKELSMKIAKEKEIFSKKNNRDATISEIADIVGEDVSLVAQAINSSVPVLSLTPVDENNNDGSQIDVIVESPEESIAERLALTQAMSQLESKDRQIINMRFYLNLTQQQTANKLGMTQVQISRREKIILSQLRLKLTS